jgi:hypothetical protein
VGAVLLVSLLCILVARHWTWHIALFMGLFLVQQPSPELFVERQIAL